MDGFTEPAGLGSQIARRRDVSGKDVFLVLPQSPYQYRQAYPSWCTYRALCATKCRVKLRAADLDPGCIPDATDPWAPLLQSKWKLGPESRAPSKSARPWVGCARRQRAKFPMLTLVLNNQTHQALTVLSTEREGHFDRLHPPGPLRFFFFFFFLSFLFSQPNCAAPHCTAVSSAPFSVFPGHRHLSDLRLQQSFALLLPSPCSRALPSLHPRRARRVDLFALRYGQRVWTVK